LRHLQTKLPDILADERARVVPDRAAS
jgi:hypothetical protein